MGVYILWHYGEALRILLSLWQNAILFPIYCFSVPLHISTLFSPWKRQHSSHETPGFHPQDMVKDLSFDLISRVVGSCMRMVMIATGIFFCLCTAVAGAIGISLWLMVPGIGFVWWGRLLEKEEISVPVLLDDTQNNLPLLAMRVAGHPQSVWIWQRLGINPQTVLSALQQQSEMDHAASWDMFQRELTKLRDADHAATASDEMERSEIQLRDLLIALTSAYQPLSQFLHHHALGKADMHRLCIWYEAAISARAPSILLDREKIRQMPGIGADWAYGYTATVDRFAHEMTGFPTPYPLLIGRENEMRQIENILLKSENNNALIIGEPGVDRHILLKTLASRLSSGHCQPALAHQRLLLLDMHAIISAQQSTGHIKGYLTTLLEEARHAGNVIICIDELDRYVTTKEDRMDFTDIWEKLAIGHQSFIAISTPEHFHRYIQQNPTLIHLFEIVHIEPPPTDVVRVQLQSAIVPILETKYSVWILYQTIEKVLEDAARYLSATPFPGGAVNLLDEVCVQVSLTQSTADTKTARVVLPRHVDAFISEKFHTAVGSVESNEREKLRKIEELLHERIVGQDTAVLQIAGTLRRARLHLSAPNKPMGSFLFLGPTGVGKTETAKTMAEVYFGSEERILRFDMGEFQKEEGIRRLIGSVDGAPGELTTKVRENPFCVILFDEFEKADREIYNLFLPLIDEGYLTDASGSRADARNAFIIATSNAGSEWIREHMGQSNNEAIQLPNTQTHNLLEYIQSENIFSPELLNRFDAVVTFTPLSEEQVKILVTRMLKGLNTRLAQEHVSIEITDALIESVAKKGYDPQYGARAIRRIIQETVEDQIAKTFLAGGVKPGTILHITPTA